MKCINERWQIFSSKILPDRLLLLELSACGETATEYGAPYAKHTIKRKVIDKDTGSPIINANVIIKLSRANHRITDILKVNDKGEFIYCNESTSPIENYRIVSEDKSSYYKTDFVEAKITNSDLKGGKNGMLDKPLKIILLLNQKTTIKIYDR